jgi:hypothetical protein
MQSDFYVVGGRVPKHIVMEQIKTLSQGQREMFARLLAEARKREETLLEPDYQLENRVRDEFLPKLAKEKGASEMIAKVAALSKELDNAQNALKRVGFDWSHGNLSLSYEAPDDLDKALEEAQRAAKAERKRSLRKYDLAILNVWSAQSADEAKGIVEALL